MFGLGVLAEQIWFAVDISVLNIIWRLFAVLLFKGTVTQSTTSYRAKRTDIFDLRGTNGTYFVYIWPCSARYHLRVIKCTCFKVDCISYSASCRTSVMESWNTMALVALIWGTLIWPYSVEAYFGVIWYTCYDVSWKMDGVWAIWSEIQISVTLVTHG